MSCSVLYLPLLVLGSSLALANVVVPISVADTPVVAGEPLSNSKLVYHETAGRLEDLRLQLVEDVQLDSVPVDVPGNTEPHGGPSQQLKRRKRFWSSSESEEEPAPEPDHSGYAAAMDALLEYYTEVQRQGRREVDMPDMTKRSTERMFFMQVSKVLSVSGVRLRVPATLSRVSRVSAQRAPSGEIDMSMDVRLGDFETWGQYDAKIGGIGPSGDFRTTIRGRVVRVTVRFSELPERSEGEVPGRCRLEADELVLVERGDSDVPAFLASWAAEVEDVPTTLHVMKQLLDERLAQFPCGDAFVGFVRRGDAPA